MNKLLLVTYPLLNYINLLNLYQKNRKLQDLFKMFNF